MKKNVSFIALLVVLSSCTGSYTPKPRGFIRIEPPTSQYFLFDEAELPYSFSLSQNTTIELPPTDSTANWINIDYPCFDAKIYCSYNRIIAATLREHTDECIKLAERSARNAVSITENYYENKENNVYGTFFLIEGESASPIQFMLTDSVMHFFRGALYYKYKTNSDSIAPVTEYIKNDIVELFQTFYWKN